jgi:acyl dehydratase
MTCILEACGPGAIVAERVFGPFAREDLRRYAAASGDLNPLHLDTEFARQAGFDDVIVHGMLGMALLGRLVTESLPAYLLLTFRARFRHIIRVGETIHCRARVHSRQENTSVLDLEACNPAGTVLIDGTATVTHSRG